MRNSIPPREGARAPAPPTRPSNRGPRVPWTHIPVERLDLDQFGDDGQLVERPYRPLRPGNAGEGR